MANKEIERKIAVIFATDVVGYSKSVEKNEEQTIKNFRACKKILEDLFKEHDGRIFNTAGDSVLAEFSSAVSAVICATEFQRLLKERNDSESTDLKMEFRIGINMGDVVFEGYKSLAKEYFDKQKSMKGRITKKSIEIRDFSTVKSKLFVNEYVKVLQSLGMPDQ